MDIKIKTNDLKFKFRVSAIFIYNNKLLVDEYGNDNKYCLPGGYVCLGEDSEVALLRELKEEIGIGFKIKQFAGITENFFTNFKNEKTQSIDLYYSVELKNHHDFDLIQYNRVEDDNGYIINHNFHWIELQELESYNLLPKAIKKDITKKINNFHYIIKDN